MTNPSFSPDPGPGTVLPATGLQSPAPTDEPGEPQPRRRRVRSRIMGGLIVIVPVWLCFVLVSFVFRILRDASIWVIDGLLRTSFGEPLLRGWGVTREEFTQAGLDSLPSWIQWAMAALAVLLTIALLYLLGGLTANVMGRRFVRALESLVARVPLVKTVYTASKQVLETFAGESTRPFQRVVLVPFPSREMRSVAFVTHTSAETTTGELLYTVFIATTPNPTTGFVFVVRQRDVIEIDWTIDKAVQVMMSGGVLMPEQVPMT